MILPTIKAVTVLAAVHMWYDRECCANWHCHPVELGEIRELKDGVLVPNFGMLDYSDPRLRKSQDDMDHICVSQTKQLICVYLRPNGM
jgi:hypothetical protein